MNLNAEPPDRLNLNPERWTKDFCGMHWNMWKEETKYYGRKEIPWSWRKKDTMVSNYGI